MPKMVMTHRSKPHWVPTTLGFAYLFTPNVPVDVHPSCVEICQGQGAAFVDKEEEREAALDGNVAEKKEPLTMKQIRIRMTALFRKMKADPGAYRSHFTAGNRPKVAFVQQEIGTEVQANIVDDLWVKVVNE